jgi:N-acetylglucosamine-6-phosphate deacetylase
MDVLRFSYSAVRTCVRPSRFAVTAPYALVGEVLTPEAVGSAAVLIQGGKIIDLLRSLDPKDLPPEQRTVSGTISPGVIDLQINGAFGIDVGPDAGGLRTLAGKLPQTGTTSFLPTAISWPAERYEAFLEALEDASSDRGARILGTHLKRPFLSPARKGAYDPDNLRSVDPCLLREFLSSGGVRVMTLAPRLPGSQKAAELIRESGTVASVGHTDATYEETLRALDAGFSKGTHLYNAMSSFKHRAPGAVGGLLTDDRIRAGIIADGVHVHEGALRFAYRKKGPDGLALVTDAMEAAGMAEGEYELSGRRVRLENGSVRLPDGTLAGSALTMDRAVRKAVRLLGISLENAVRMVSETPAEILGLPEKGRVAPVADADLVVLSPEGVVEETIVASKTVYHRGEGNHAG